MVGVMVGVVVVVASPAPAAAAAVETGRAAGPPLPGYDAGFVVGAIDRACRGGGLAVAVVGCERRC